MNKLMISIIALTIFSWFLPTQALAKVGVIWKGGGGWGPGSAYGRMYNPHTVETVTGEVVSVEKITPRKGMFYGIHMQLKQGQAITPVHLGPGWYIENQDIKIEPGDQVEVIGSRIIYDGKPAVIAGEVKKGNETLMLRDENGVPVWSGWRRR